MAAGVPADASNLVLRAAGLMPDTPARITLEKHLPAAAGIGGGSSDAAATLRALSDLGGTLPEAEAIRALGADVPVCLANCPTRMRGIGERLDPLPQIPPAYLVLVNPGVGTPTASVFTALNGQFADPMPKEFPDWPDAAAFAAWLRCQRNDLEGPAKTITPVIGDVLAALSVRPDCLLARMSGSGATCFGLFTTAEAAQSASVAISEIQPNWWVQATPILDTRPG